MIAETIPQLKSLSADEKMILAAELWKEAVADEVEEPDPALVAALQERLDYYRKHPDEVSSWEDVKARLLSRKRSK